VIFLGDTTRPGLEPAAAVGFLVAVASAVMLARFGEADRQADGEADRDASRDSDRGAGGETGQATGGEAGRAAKARASVRAESATGSAETEPQAADPAEVPPQRSSRDDPSALHAGELTSALPTAPGPSREASRRMLSWWPVDMRPSAASSPTTGAVS